MGDVYLPDWSEVLAVSHSHGEDSDSPEAWNGIRGLWTMVQGGGKTLFDISGYGNHGALTDMVPADDWVAGERGYTLEFDEVDDHVLIPNFSYGPNLTVSFWYNPTDNTGSDFQYIFSHGSFNTANSLNIFLHEAGEATIPNQLRTSFRDSNDSANLLDAGTEFTVGWHHYAITIGAAGANIYVDGIWRVGNAGLGGDSFNPSTDVFFGGRSDLNVDRFFGGKLSDLLIHNRALLPAEIQQLFRDPLAPLRLRDTQIPIAAAGGLLVHPGMAGGMQIMSGGMRG